MGDDIEFTEKQPEHSEGEGNQDELIMQQQRRIEQEVKGTVHNRTHQNI